MASTSSFVSASPSTLGWTYDVFLSFRGSDIRKTFIDYLYEWLELKGICTFKDDDRLQKGDCISPSLLKAIQESKFLIPVFSKDYASSKWCLEELATIMECQEKLKEQIVVPIFYHVDPSDVRNQKGSFEDSFKELEKNFKDEEEKVRRWKEALKKAGYFKGHHLQNDYNGHEAKCAEGVAADILARLNQASLAFEENLVGLESRVNYIGNWLRLASDDDDDNTRFIGICGMGGIGKTTTAMVVLNKFSHQFDGACFLADIRQHNIIELQKTLLTKILKEKSAVEISNVQDGMSKIRMRLKGKKVLIVLDDVDDQLEQLEQLAGGGDWFGRGSRVIITTRNTEVLRSHGVDEKYIYQVHTLEELEAIQLFSWYAFKKKIPKIGFEKLCGSIVRYAMGLPLALKVLGSHLCGKNPENWKSILVKLKDANSLHTPKDKILAALMISFDGLDPDNKNVFIHIACFFRNWKEEYVKDVLDSDLCVLIDKSLISVQNGSIEMHDRIQEMGWHIASKEKPRKMVWQLKDVEDVLSAEMDPKHIEAISWWCLENIGGLTLRITFRGMRNLKILKVGVGIADNAFRLMDNDLPSSLRWFEFEYYHFTSLPESFASSKLVGLSLPNSSLQNCRITQKLDKLTLLDLSTSYALLETPDFDWMPNLMRLNLRSCRSLKVVHPSIGNLRKLVLLDLSRCSDLENLPSFNQVSSLKFLYLKFCNKLKSFPEIKTRMPHLVELDLREVGIIELSSSIQQLHGLTKLRLDACEHLVCLCDDLCELKNLKVLEIKNCTNLKSLPENLQDLISLKYLNLQGSHFDSLPESFNQLPHLQYLDIRYCRKLQVLPKLPKTISQLYADCHANIADVAKEYSELNSLGFSLGSLGYAEFIWPGPLGYFLAKMMCIHSPFHRKTPVIVNSPFSSPEDSLNRTSALRFFQYRCYKSNGISIDLNPGWYCQSFVGFGVYFLSSRYGMLETRSYQDIGRYCTVIAKLLRKDNGNEVLQRKCVFVKPDDDDYGIIGDIWFVYIPFSSLWPTESNSINSVTPNDFSRFEVNFMNLEATANWGCSLLYKRRKGPAHWDYNCPGCTTYIGPSGMLEYLNLSGKEFKHLLGDISRFRRLQYLDISGRERLERELPELPPTIKELYANSYLASENNIAKLATKYSKLYSVSFSIDGFSASQGKKAILVPEVLAKKFIPITQLFLNRNTPFAVTYPASYTYTDYISRCFKYPHHDPHHDPHKISISLNPTWYSHNFVGFVVCFVTPRVVRWESHPDILPFRHCELITKLTHKDNGSEPPLQTKCVIGRLYDEEFDYSLPLDKLVCFAYIPFSSLWPKSKAITDNITPNHYLVFEATIDYLDFNISSWSCGLLYTDDESLTEAIRQKREADSSENDSGIGPKSYEEEEEEEEDGGSQQHIENSSGDDAMAKDSNPGSDRTKPWELTETVNRVQCQMVSMPECSDAKVARLLYTNSGVGILALSSDGIQKLWKWSNNKQNPSKKATANSVPQHWQPNSDLMINDVSRVNLEKVVPCIALSNDDSYVVSAVGGMVSLFNIMTFEVMKTIMSLPCASTFLAFDPHDNNIIAIGTEKSTIYIYDRVDEELNELGEHQKPITGLAFSTNLKMLVSADADAQLCDWNTRIWKKRRSVRIQLPTGEVPSSDTHVMFHVDQLHLLVTHETQLAIYDASKMECLLRWMPHGSFSAPISSATYSCNCQLVYVSFKDGNIGVLDVNTLRLRCRIAPSAYFSQAVLNRSEDVYAVVIAAHPHEPNQFAIGLTDGSVKVIEPLESIGEWGISLHAGIKILNEKEVEGEEMGDEEGGHQWKRRKKARLDKGKAPVI